MSDERIDRCFDCGGVRDDRYGSHEGFEVARCSCRKRHRRFPREKPPAWDPQPPDLDDPDPEAFEQVPDDLRAHPVHFAALRPMPR